jgi:hypothetical protein
MVYHALHLPDSTYFSPVAMFPTDLVLHHKTQLPMRHGHSSNYSLALVTLVFGTLLGCTPEAPKEEQAPAPQPLAAATKCENGDLGQRSRMYNDKTLPIAEKAFLDHFKADVDGDLKELTGTTIAMDLDAFVTLRNTLQPAPVGIMVHYGLSEEVFIPVFEFLKLDAAGAEVESMNTYYIVHNGILKKAADTPYDPDKLIDDYRANIRIMRTDGHTDWDDLNTSSTYPDPRAEWFQFDMELSKLISDNPSEGTRSLVLTSISEVVCYSGSYGILAPADEEQFRHMIAWYIAEDGTALLDNADLSEYRSNGKIYTKRAVDLGHLCPPRCK